MSSKTRKTLPENNNRLSVLIENELEKAELVIAVKAITDKLQDMAEDLAKIEADDIMPMLDSLKTAFGPQVAEQFSNTATEQVRQLVSAISSAKDAIGNEVLRLEKSVNGESGNDMAMPAGDPAGDGLGDDGLGGDGPGGDGLGDDSLGGDGLGGAGGGDPLAGDAQSGGMGDDMAGGLSDDGAMPPPKMTAAGRDKKESAVMRGRRLVEYTSSSFEANLHNLGVFDARAGALAHNVHDLIDQGRFDGNERSALANVLSHLAMCGNDMRHWEDPDAKVETALQAANIDARLPEVRTIVAKLKKLAHLIALKHDGMMETKRLDGAIKTLREAKNPDKLVLRQFLLALKETRNTARAIQSVASRFAIEPSDVVTIVREAKQATVAEARHRVPFGARPAVRPPPVVPAPAASVREADTKPRRSIFLRSPVDRSHWRSMIEGDTRAIVEAQPLKPKSPAEMRADQDAEAMQQAQAGAPAGNQAARQVTGRASPSPQTSPQGAPQDASQGGSPATPGKAAPTAQVTSGTSQVAGQRGAGTAPLPPQNVPPVLPGAKTVAGTPSVAPNGQQAAPGGATTPVGQSPQKPVPAQAQQSDDVGALNLPADMPGKAIKQLPAASVTLMSKPTPFPKPGPPLMSGAGQVAANESRKRRRTAPGLLKPAAVKPGKTRLTATPPVR